MSIPVTLVPQGAAEIEDAINKSLQALSALGQANVEATTNTPPTTTLADVTKMWLVGTAPAAGAWSGRANNLALCTAAGVWQFFAPGTNVWILWDKLALQMKRWDGSSWVVFAATSGSTNKSHISGLRMSWNSGTSITVGTGEAYVEGLSAVVQVNSQITKSSLSLSASTWYHVYMFLSAGTPDVEVSTTAPAAAYNGTARSKVGDPSRRYVGSILTNSSGQILRFNHNTASGSIDYVSHVNATPFIVLNNGAATTATNVSCANVVPITSRSAYFVVDNDDPAIRVGYGNSEMGAVSGTNFLGFIFASSSLSIQIPLDSSQQISYLYFAAPSKGFSMRVSSYTFER